MLIPKNQPENSELEALATNSALFKKNGKYAKQNNKKACKVGKTGETEKIVRDGHIA